MVTLADSRQADFLWLVGVHFLPPFLGLIGVVCLWGNLAHASLEAWRGQSGQRGNLWRVNRVGAGGDVGKCAGGRARG